MCVGGERGAAGQHDADASAHQLGDLLEYQLVEQRRLVAARAPELLVVVGELEDGLLERGLAVDLVVDALRDAVQDQRHGRHARRLQHGGVASAAAHHLAARVDQGGRRGVADRDAGQQADALGQQLEHVRQRQESGMADETLVGGKALGGAPKLPDQHVLRVDLDDVRERLHGGDAVLVREQHSLGGAGRAGRVHDDRDVVRRGRRALDLAGAAGAQHLRERQDLDVLLEPVGLRLVQLVLHVDDGVHVGQLLQQRLELGQQIVAGDDDRRLRLLDAVDDAVVAERRVDRHDGDVLLEAAVGGDHPLGARLRKDDDVLERLLAELAQRPPELRGEALDVDERAPLVVAHFVLLEDAPVRLPLVLLAEDLSRAQAALVRVNFRRIVEHLLQRVDVRLEHLHVKLTRRLNRPVRDLLLIARDRLRLQCIESKY